jgi:hypothetical protein
MTLAALVTENFCAQLAKASARLPACAGITKTAATAAPANKTPNFPVLIVTHPFYVTGL